MADAAATNKPGSGKAKAGAKAPKRVVPLTATVLVKSKGEGDKKKLPILPGLVVAFRSATLSPIVEKADKARATDAEKEAAPPPPPEWSAGVVDRRGYLVPLATRAALRLGKKEQRTDSIKLIPPAGAGATYDFFFIAHPSDAKLTAILKNINEHRGVYVEANGSEVKPVAVALEPTGGKGNEHALLVPESPKEILPREGSTEYDGWLLFRDMPHQAVPAVAKQIEKLQRNLVGMRYPIGEPYYCTEKKGGNRGQFDVRTWNGVLAFQRDYAGAARPQVNAAGEPIVDRTARPFVKADKVGAIAGIVHKDQDDYKAIASAQRQEKTSGTARPSAEDAAKVKADGVVDATTGEALRAAVAAGWRRPGPILHPFDTVEVGEGNYAAYMREEGVAAVAQWRALAKAFGLTHGVNVGSSQRTVLADIQGAAYGRAKLSIHKSGYALDLWNRGHIIPWATPNVFYEHVSQPNGRTRFRLWATIPFAKASIEKGFDEVAAVLAERHNAVVGELRGSDGTARTVEASTVAAKLKACVAGSTFDEVALERAVGVHGEDDGLVKTLRLEKEDSYGALLEQDLQHLLSRKVTEFRYHRDHPSFATDATDFKVEREAAPTELFLCLTTLARLAFLTGISAFADGWHTTRKAYDLKEGVTPQDGAAQFAGAVSAIGTANDRYDESLVKGRAEALAAHAADIVVALGDDRAPLVQSNAPRPAAQLEPLAATIAASAFQRRVKPLFGSQLESGTGEDARALQDEVSRHMRALAMVMLTKQADAVKATRKQRMRADALLALEEGAPHRAAIADAIARFEAKRPLGSELLWSISLQRAGEKRVIALKDLHDGAVEALKAWSKETGEKKIAVTPDLTATDLLVKVDKATRNVTIDPKCKRTKMLEALLAHASLAKTTYFVRSAFVETPKPAPKDGAADAKAPKKQKAAAVEPTKHVIEQVHIAGAGELRAAIEKVLTSAYVRAEQDARKERPVVEIRPRFPEPFEPEAPAGAPPPEPFFAEGTRVEVHYPGEPIGMEWWHYQYHPALEGEAEEGAAAGARPKNRLWSSLLTDIGWELDVLGSGTIEDAYGYPGVGYSEKDLAKRAG